MTIEKILFSSNFKIVVSYSESWNWNGKIAATLRGKKNWTLLENLHSVWKRVRKTIKVEMASRMRQNTSNVSDTSTSSHRTQSSTCHSRISEKLELQGLNDRLAGYIDRVRFLESENNRLTLEVKTVHETVTRETVNVKKVCICFFLSSFLSYAPFASSYAICLIVWFV